LNQRSWISNFWRWIYISQHSYSCNSTFWRYRFNVY